MSSDIIQWFGVTLEIILVVIAVIKFYGKKVIENNFNEKLENHKHDLNLITEETKFSYGRMNQDFGLWTVKRHEAYANIHATSAEAISRVIKLRGIMSCPDYEHFSEEEIERILKDRHFIQSDIDSVIKVWESDRHFAMKQFNKLDKLYREHQAQLAWGKANNTLIESQLYVSDDTYKMLDALLRDTYFLLTNYRSGYWNEEKGKEEEALASMIPENFKKITVKMRTELSGNYFIDQ